MGGYWILIDSAKKEKKSSLNGKHEKLSFQVFLFFFSWWNNKISFCNMYKTAGIGTYLAWLELCIETWQVSTESKQLERKKSHTNWIAISSAWTDFFSSFLSNNRSIYSCVVLLYVVRINRMANESTRALSYLHFKFGHYTVQIWACLACFSYICLL